MFASSTPQDLGSARLARGVSPAYAGAYRNPTQLGEGAVLVVGAGNSGADVAIELAGEHTTWLAGRHPGHIPFDIDGSFARTIGLPFVNRFLYHRVLSTSNPVGRFARPRLIAKGGPLMRYKPSDLKAAGVRRLGRIEGVREGRAVADDGRALDVANVVWCTGFRPDFSWIDIGVFDADADEPRHVRGVVPEAPGLYFVGLCFQHAVTSSMFSGLDRDAAYVTDHLARRMH